MDIRFHSEEILLQKIIQNFYKDPIRETIMVEETIGGRPVTITKDGDKVKIIFHPIKPSIPKNAKASMFTVTLSNADLTKIKKSL